MLKSVSLDSSLNSLLQEKRNKKFKLKLILEKKNEEIHIIKKDEKWCLNCRKISDHGIKNCPNKKIVCMNCNHKGHYKYDCYIYKNACYRCLSYGRIIYKEECLEHKNISVCGCIIMNENKDKLLLVKGATSECWGFPKGALENGESNIECAKRETMEETGLDVIITKDSVKEVINGITYYNVTVSDRDTNIKYSNVIDKSEICEIKWFKISELINNNNNNKIKVNKSIKLYITNLYSV